MVGRLVEQQQLRRHHQCARQCHTLAHTAGEQTHAIVAIQADAGDGGIHHRLCIPAAAVLELRLQRIQTVEQCRRRIVAQPLREFIELVQQRLLFMQTTGHRIKNSGLRIKVGFLRHKGKGKAGLAPELAIVELYVTDNQFDQT